MRCLGLVCFVGLTMAALGAAPTSEPAGTEHRAIASGLIDFIVPANPPWSTPEHDEPDAQLIVYTTANREGQMALVLQPKDAPSDDHAAVAIIKYMRAQREKSGVKVILPATIEKDSRFAIKIHEKFKSGDRVEDDVHLYKTAGPRLLELVSKSVAADEAGVDAIHKAGEDLILSIKYNKEAAKR